ncbi:MAG: TIGR03960 family B12-binding radical SAM protein [Spirochaetes bacterium]|nr:MAG: TIGR03960 family B12-binding radical SAM protein [Spirochaetota bacterium]
MKKIDNDTFAQLVHTLQKPARYAGGEYNRIVREHAALRMAISYPDLYEVGMSNHGIQILYDIANSIEGVACERVFAVPPEFEARARAMGVPLFTLETRTPLRALDIIGFNFSHELLCTNILQVLDLGGIPLLARERGVGFPIVIAGGEASCNPAPMADFIDAFFIGDGEEGIRDIVKCVLKGKLSGLSRAEIIDALGEIPGVYLPPAHREVWEGDTLAAVEGPRVRKRIFRADTPLDPERPVVPSMRIAQERAVAELSRGCANLCKFCHAGYYDLPCRNHLPGPMRERIERMIANTGYNELTLTSLSISDYPYLNEMLGDVLPWLTRKGVSIALPSLRVDLATLPIIERISDLRKSSLTFAVESASEKMRRHAHKNLSNADLMAILARVFEKGWRTIKLYFMIGLPGCERIDEAEATVELLRSINGLSRGKKEINVTVSPFVPKPHTPFQWERQMDRAYLIRVISSIKRSVTRNITIKNHDVDASLLEGLLARGDTRMGKVILAVYRDGARLDSWSEHFDVARWNRAIDEHLPDHARLMDVRPDDAVFPWSAVETGFEMLVKHKKDRGLPAGKKSLPSAAPDETGPEALGAALKDFSRTYETNLRVRAMFEKTGDARFIPHIDFMEIIKRALRMAEAPVSSTQGFNKRERISLGYPLSVGVESVSEPCDIDLYESADLKTLLAGMNQRLPAGISVKAIRTVEGKESLQAITAGFEYRLETAETALAQAMAHNLDARIGFTRTGKSGTREVPFETAVIEHRAEVGGTVLVIPAGGENSVRIDDMAAALAGVSKDELYRIRIVRMKQLMKADGEGLREIQ